MKKQKLLIYVVLFLIFSGVNVYMFWQQRNIKKSMETIQPSSKQTNSNDSDEFVKFLEEYKKTLEQFQDNQGEPNVRELIKLITDFKQYIDKENLDKQIRSIFEKNKTLFEEQKDDQESFAMIQLMNKFLLCHEEVEKSKNLFNSQYNTYNEAELTNKLDEIDTARKYLYNFAIMIDIYHDAYYQLNKVKVEDKDYKKTFIKKIQNSAKLKVPLIKKINEALMKKKYKNNQLLEQFKILLL